MYDCRHNGYYLYGYYLQIKFLGVRGIKTRYFHFIVSCQASSASHPGIVHNQLHKSTNQNASNFDEIKVNDNNANPTNGVIQGKLVLVIMYAIIFRSRFGRIIQVI